MESSVLQAALFAAEGAVCAAAAFTDVRARVIPNRLVLAALVLWAAGVAAQALAGEDARPLLSASLGGALCVVAPMLAAARLAGGVGGGDVKLLGVLGLALGPCGSVALLMLACLLEVTFSLVRHLVCRLRGRSGRLLAQALPLAPFVALAYPLAVAIRCSC